MKNRQVSYEDIRMRNNGNQRKFTSEEARSIRAWLKINWSQINLEQFCRGLEVEFDMGADDPEINAPRDTAVLASEQPAVA